MVSIPETGTDNAKVTEDKIAVYGKNGILHIHAVRPSTGYIYSFDGRLLKILPLTTGDTQQTLSRGQYIIRVDSQIFKVVL